MIISHKTGRKNYSVDLCNTLLIKHDITGIRRTKISPENKQKVKSILAKKMTNNIAKMQDLEYYIRKYNAKKHKDEYKRLKRENQQIINFSVKEKIYL